jgi:hypothetical protein
MGAIQNIIIAYLGVQGAIDFFRWIKYQKTGKPEPFEWPVEQPLLENQNPPPQASYAPIVIKDTEDQNQQQQETGTDT